jgi:hypothetical protein
LSKSDIILVGEIDDGEGLASILGCGVALLPIIYLGLPLGAHYKAAHIWSSIIAKMERKLAGWKRRYLSKLALIKNTLKFANIFLISIFYSSGGGKSP